MSRPAGGAAVVTLTCACGSARLLPLSDIAVIDWCPACGTGVTVPPPSRDVHGDGLFEDAQAGYGGERLAAQNLWLHEASVRLNWIRKYVPVEARILEIGSATGEFVAVAQRAGHDVVGLETSGWAVGEAKRITEGVIHAD